jgi:hypothetical protein
VDPGGEIAMNQARGIPSGQDAEHLHLLSIFHWIVAGISALCSLFPIFHLAMGIAMASGHLPDKEGFTRLMGWFFIFFAGGFICFGLVYSVCLAYAGQCLAKRRNRTYCLVIAAFSCMFFPFGTALGVFTIVVLSRDSVRALFDGAPPAAIRA